MSKTGDTGKAELSVESAIKDFLSAIKRLKELDLFRSGQYLGDFGGVFGKTPRRSDAESSVLNFPMGGRSRYEFRNFAYWSVRGSIR